jgi:hypothetical protein
MSQSVLQQLKISKSSHSLQAAVMGDIVSSQSAASMRLLHQKFNEAVRAANERSKPFLTSPLTITLGDEFQGLCRSLSAGLRIIRDLRHNLMQDRIECRFALGVVELQTPLNRQAAWNMMGPGLSRTRKKLEAKGNANAYRFSLPGEHMIEMLLDAVGYSITNVELDWTARQLQIIMASSASDGTDIELATTLGITRRTLYKVRKAGRYGFYDDQWSVIEQTVSELDKRYGFE